MLSLRLIDSGDFLEKRPAALLIVYYEKSAGTCLSILSWEGLNLLASSVVTEALYSKHRKPRQWAANEAIVVFSVCTCIATHLMMDLNQKLIKSMPREDTCCSMFTIRQKCLCKKLGVKKWGGICLKRTYFQGFTVSMYQLTNFLWHKLWRFVSRSYITRADIALSAKFESF